MTLQRNGDQVCVGVWELLLWLFQLVVMLVSWDCSCRGTWSSHKLQHCCL